MITYPSSKEKQFLVVTASVADEETGKSGALQLWDTESGKLLNTATEDMNVSYTQLQYVFSFRN
jgi:hypothetical protein